jgi:plastocyanin
VGAAADIRVRKLVSDPTPAVGTKVTFTNKDQTEHTATNGKDGIRAANALFDLSLKAGASDSFTFDKAGTYDVTCRFHPAMHMTITVG